MIEIPYKIPLSHIFLFIGLALIFCLGTHGYIDDSFSQTSEAKAFTTMSLIILIIWIISSPRNKKIVVSSEGIEIPSVLFPPFKANKISWRDLYKTETRSHRNGAFTLVFQSKKGVFKVSSWLCLKDFEFTMYPDSFNELEATVDVLHTEYKQH
jgi:hypothetical protein